MFMKLSKKVVIIVVINLPKYFESHFSHVTRKTTYNVYILCSKMRNINTSTFLKRFDIYTFSTTVPTECRLLMWYSLFTF